MTDLQTASYLLINGFHCYLYRRLLTLFLGQRRVGCPAEAAGYLCAYVLNSLCFLLVGVPLLNLASSLLPLLLLSLLYRAPHWQRLWSALVIYQVDGDPYFKEMAIALAKVVMDCQQQEIPDWNIPFTGFFYRDPSKKLIVHYNHRSHEHEPILALSMLCEQFPEHPDWIKWYYAIVLWSEYYKKAVAYNAP